MYRAMAEIRSKLTRRSLSKRMAREDLLNRAFDARYGTDTSDALVPSTGGVADPAARPGHGIYYPAWEIEFRKAIAVLDVDLSQFVFVDFGSGKGKALLLASDYPFARIIGVEHAALLHEIALRNCAVYRSPNQACHDILPLHRDATSWEPPSEPLVCYFFSPLDTGTMRLVLDGLNRSHERDPRPIYIIYQNPRTVTERSAAFSIVTRFGLVNRRQRQLVFRSLPDPRRHGLVGAGDPVAAE
jgi:hypothetical protein